MKWAGKPSVEVPPASLPAPAFAPPLSLRYMRMGDIDAVVAIDRQCFQPAWTHESYRFELQESTVSHMLVLEKPAGLSTAPAELGWLERLRGRIGGAPQPGGSIVGYGGIWKVADEAHISTVATHPACRRAGYGELLLAGMVGKALQLGASYIVLEVRVSNEAALSLYGKYGFERVGRRRRYYASNEEDAWDMRLTLDKAARQHCAESLERLRAGQDFVDRYSRARHPRRLGAARNPVAGW